MLRQHLKNLKKSISDEVDVIVRAKIDNEMVFVTMTCQEKLDDYTLTEEEKLALVASLENGHYKEVILEVSKSFRNRLYP